MAAMLAEEVPMDTSDVLTILEEMTKPMLPMVTPIQTPCRKNSGDFTFPSQVVPRPVQMDREAIKPGAVPSIPVCNLINIQHVPAVLSPLSSDSDSESKHAVNTLLSDWMRVLDTENQPHPQISWSTPDLHQFPDLSDSSSSSSDDSSSEDSSSESSDSDSEERENPDTTSIETSTLASPAQVAMTTPSQVPIPFSDTLSIAPISTVTDDLALSSENDSDSESSESESGSSSSDSDDGSHCDDATEALSGEHQLNVSQTNEDLVVFPSPVNSPMCFDEEMGFDPMSQESQVTQLFESLGKDTVPSEAPQTNIAPQEMSTPKSLQPPMGGAVGGASPDPSHQQESAIKVRKRANRDLKRSQLAACSEHPCSQTASKMEKETSPPSGQPLEQLHQVAGKKRKYSSVDSTQGEPPSNDGMDSGPMALESDQTLVIKIPLSLVKKKRMATVEPYHVTAPSEKASRRRSEGQESVEETSHRVGPIAMYPVNVSGCGFFVRILAGGGTFPKHQTSPDTEKNAFLFIATNTHAATIEATPTGPGTGSTLVLDIAMVTLRGDMTTHHGESITTVSTGDYGSAHYDRGTRSDYEEGRRSRGYHADRSSYNSNVPCKKPEERSMKLTV
eukprot:Em0872g2a